MYWFVPERVTNLICTAPWPASAPCPAVVTETSSIASRRGLTIEKKPSLVRFVLSCTLIPSRVMLITPCGRPLIVALRLPPGVETPGRKLTKSMALRDVSGSFVIWFVVIVEAIVVDWVWMISDDDATVTVSERPPISSVALMFAPCAAVTTTLFTR